MTALLLKAEQKAVVQRETMRNQSRTFGKARAIWSLQPMLTCMLAGTKSDAFIVFGLQTLGLARRGNEQVSTRELLLGALPPSFPPSLPRHHVHAHPSQQLFASLVAFRTCTAACKWCVQIGDL